MTGRFITLEGGEGVGKSTQIRALAAALGARDIETVATREPGGSAGAEAIRALLMEGTVMNIQSAGEDPLGCAQRSPALRRCARRPCRADDPSRA